MAIDAILGAAAMPIRAAKAAFGVAKAATGLPKALEKRQKVQAKQNRQKKQAVEAGKVSKIKPKNAITNNDVSKAIDVQGNKNIYNGPLKVNQSQEELKEMAKKPRNAAIDPRVKFRGELDKRLDELEKSEIFDANTIKNMRNMPMEELAAKLKIETPKEAKSVRDRRVRDVIKSKKSKEVDRPRFDKKGNVIEGLTKTAGNVNRKKRSEAPKPKTEKDDLVGFVKRLHDSGDISDELAQKMMGMSLKELYERYGITPQDIKKR